jgi:arabinogalactan endo-1,4-beta-galactosidase
LYSCRRDDKITDKPEIDNSIFVSSLDLSAYPEISNSNQVFYDFEGRQIEFLKILKEKGVNTVRLRLWVNPINEHSGISEVKQFSTTLKSQGFKTWLTLHYSDTWADPNHQKIPQQWQEISFAALKDSLSNYTKKVVNEMQPDFIQIGNEINSGFLFPFGHISNNFKQFVEMMNTAIAAVRTNSDDTEIIIHFAGIYGSDWFFNQVKALDYDIIGLSYYPIWHGKSLNNLRIKMQQLSDAYHKKLVIAETAYPFTLDWNDWTNNIVGINEQLILPEFPATAQGQRDFIRQIKTISKEVNGCIGFCYWGGELISWKGAEAKDGSPWENQALFNFQNKALPVIAEFKSE